MQITDIQFQELEDNVQEISEKLMSYVSDVQKISEKVTERDNFQLKEPLDTITRSSINNQITIPVTITLAGTSPATSGNYNHFFTSDRSYIISSVLAIWSVAGSDGGAVTLDVYKAGSGTAIGSGSSILSSTINLKGTANTVNVASLNSGDRITLKQYDRLGLVLTGTPTAVANLSVTINLKQL